MASINLMDAARMARTLSRIAHEIVERHPDPRRLALVGVRSRGVPLARRLAKLVGEATGSEPAVGALDIALYRDDFTSLAAQPITKGTDIVFSIDGRTVIVVDDVLFTGRTVRAALDQLIDFGRPSRIELAVLVDRGHRELPIRADYVGRVLGTSREEAVQVLVSEEDGRDEVLLSQREQRSAPASRSRKPRVETKRVRPAKAQADARAVKKARGTTKRARPTRAANPRAVKKARGEQRRRR